MADVLKKRTVIAVAVLLIIIPSTGVLAQGASSGLPLPRFVSFRTEPVNMRTGPGVRYPVDWVYNRRLLPVEVIAEFDTWRRVRDPEGVEGWVHQSMLSGQRSGMTTDTVHEVYKGSNETSAVIARLEPGVVFAVERCPRQTEFCLINVGDIAGWVRRTAFWGLYDGETFN